LTLGEPFGVALKESGFTGVEWSDDEKLNMMRLVREVGDIIASRSSQSTAFVRTNLEVLWKYMKEKENHRLVDLYREFQAIESSQSFHDHRRNDHETFKHLLDWNQRLYDLILMTPSSPGKKTQCSNFAYIKKPFSGS